MTSVRGLHHVTAIASDPQRTVDFYGGVLGLRLVKRTVNFDDPQTYHFYFGDETGTPGSLLTFFAWPDGEPGRVGVGQVAITAFSIAREAIGFWIQRLLRHGIAYQGPIRRTVPGGSSEQVISFRDRDGLMLELVADAVADPRSGVETREIPRDRAIRGLHSVTLWVEKGEPTERVLVDSLGFNRIGEDGSTRRYAVGDGGPGAMVNVRSVGGFVAGVTGVGTVHHVAWSVDSDEAELGVRDATVRAGLDPTPVIDRSYFHSVYFREPGGILFEIATAGPGFTNDEPVEHLGELLMLPPQHASRRAQIEAGLPPIRLSHASGDATPFADMRELEPPAAPKTLGYVHRYMPSKGDASPRARATTLLLLHGTGADENDLLPLADVLMPGAGVLSPRGNVLERGMPRFFRRLAEGVFDQGDLARRTAEMAAFIEAAAAGYGFDPRGVVAVGFSNGANIAASVLLSRPDVLRTAILLSPMVPFEPPSAPDLSGTAVFIGAGRADPIASPDHPERLAEMLRRAGADVTLHWEPGGHKLTPREIETARDWLGQPHRNTTPGRG